MAYKELQIYKRKDNMGLNLGKLKLCADQDPNLASHVRDLVYFNKVTKEAFILACERFNKIESPSLRQVMYMQVLGNEALKLMTPEDYVKLHLHRNVTIPCNDNKMPIRCAIFAT